MASSSVKYVFSHAELPNHDRSVLVTFGVADAQMKQGERIIISVNPDPLSDHLARLRLMIAVETARALARREGIETIYIAETLIRG